MTAERRVPAVGGTRTVPEPDPIARDYLLLGLRLDQHVPGLIDAYYGPASLKAQVELEPKRSPAALRDDAASLRARVAEEIDAPDRRTWLTAQLVALEAQAGALAGDALPYVEHVARAFDFTPRRVPDEALDAAARRIDELLPGDGDLIARIDAWDASLEIPEDRRSAVMDWLLERFQARSAELFGLPPGERLRVSFVRNQPWSAYNWYDGGLRSRVDVNTDLPTHLPGFAHTVAHEAYPGHHLEHAWKEADLVERGRVECSALLINTPECFISEGLADLGFEFASPPDGAPGPARRGVRAGGDPAGCRPGATPGGGRAGGRTDGTARDVADVTRERGADAPRRWCPASGGPGLPGVGPAAIRGPSPRSGSSFSSTPCGGRTSSSTARVRHSCGAGWTRFRNGIAPGALPVSSTSN